MRAVAGVPLNIQMFEMKLRSSYFPKYYTAAFHSHWINLFVDYIHLIVKWKVILDILESIEELLF